MYICYSSVKRNKKFQIIHDITSDYKETSQILLMSFWQVMKANHYTVSKVSHGDFDL